MNMTNISYVGKPFQSKTDFSIQNYSTICFSYQDRKETTGIFQENPLNSLFPVFMLQIILAISISWVLYFLLRPLKQPRFVCNILAGIILGPSVLGRNKAFLDTMFPEEEKLIFNFMVRLGIVYWIFIIAVKSELTMLLKSARKFWSLGIFSFIIPFAITVFFSFAVKTELHPRLKDMQIGFICLSLSATYFPSVAQALQQLDILTTEFGQLALSSSMLIQMTCLILGFAVVIVTKHTFIVSFLYFFSFCAIISFAIFTIRPALVLINNRTPPGKSVKEVYVVGIFVMNLLMVFVTDTLLVDFESGALLMGLIVPQGSRLSATLVEKSELLVNEIFMPLFYVQIGILADLSSLNQADLKQIYALLALIIVSILSKLVGTFLASLYLKVTPQNALLLGLIINIRGVLDMATFIRYRTYSNLDVQSYTVLVISSIIFIAVYHSWVEIAYKPKLKLIGRYSKTKCSKSLQSDLEIKELRVIACIYNEDDVHGMISLLEACNYSEISPVCAYVVHAIDLVGRTSPSLTPYRSQKRSSTEQNGSTTSHIMQAFEMYSKSSEGHISILPFTMDAPIRTMHHIICNLAEEKHVALSIIPFNVNQVGNIGNGSFKDFTVQLQTHAPCTVGILLDKGFHPHINLGKLCCRIVVLFIGGADDREALSLAFRMSKNPNLNITIIKINSPIDRETDAVTDMVLDDMVLKQFMDNNQNNNCVFYCEENVNNSYDMVNVVRSLGDKYDLALVGKSSSATQIENEMLQWTEHQDLGVIGDVLASDDFFDNSMSVLVTKHFSSGQ